MKGTTILLMLFAMLFAVNAAAQDASALVEQGDQHFQQRDNPATLNKAIAAYEKALAQTPDDEALRVKLAIAYYWKGNNMPASAKNDRMAAYQKGMDCAQKILAAKPQSVGGNFWYATNKACHGRERGIVKSASYLPELKKHMAIVEKQDRFYYNGGPQRFYARIITRAPGFLRKSFGYDLKEAEKMLKAAIVKHPNFSMTHLYLADVYIELDQKEDAKKELQYVLDMQVNVVPRFAPEVRRDKKLAAQRMEKHFGGK